MGLSNMCILGVILILFIFVPAVLIYVELCCEQKPRRTNNHYHKSGNKSSDKSDSMSAAEIGVVASYISDSGGDSGSYSGGGSGGGD